MKTFKKIVFWGLVLLIIIQLVPVDRTNQPIDSRVDFVHVMNTPEKITQILKNACYDCHTNETKYPKYAYIAPISWSVKHHVNEGREHANFSIWGTYNQDIKKSIIDNTIATVRDRRMPFPGYIAQHPEANLTDAERKLITNYFEEILNSGNY